MTTARWSFDRIESWARALASSGLGSVEVEEDGFRVRLESAAPLAPPPPAVGPVSRPSSGGVAPTVHPGPSLRAGRGGAAVASLSGGTVVTAPRVGYFQRATRQDASRRENGVSRPATSRPLHAGDTVDAGEVLGEIVVLSVPYEVKSTAAGRIREILVEDGLGVEYGQPLFVLE